MYIYIIRKEYTNSSLHCSKMDQVLRENGKFEFFRWSPGYLDISIWLMVYQPIGNPRKIIGTPTGT